MRKLNSLYLYVVKMSVNERGKVCIEMMLIDDDV